MDGASSGRCCRQTSAMRVGARCVVMLTLGLLLAGCGSGHGGRAVPTTTRATTAASGKGGPAVNLQISAADRAALRQALLASGGAASSEVEGPLPGTVFYARYGGTEYAIATFSYAQTGETDQPERFSRPAGAHAWHHDGDSGGPLADFLPCPVLQAWQKPC